MARKSSVRFACTNCGAITAAWAGRCPQCAEWNTLQEEVVTPVTNILGSLGSAGTGQSATGRALQSEAVDDVIAHDLPRITTDISDVDTVLGGGIVPGSVVLLAGQPGIGKSTLLLQLTHNVAHNHDVLYVSAEESAHQVGLRASRLGAKQGRLRIATSTSADDIAATVAEGKYTLVIVDSIQTVACASIASAPGSVSQITNSTTILMQSAKQSGTALVIVGHVTKEGAIAGPKVLEHVVDVVLQLEGDRYGGFKILRAVKNRFGSTSEAGIFEMVDSGLRTVENPSAALLSERQASDGSIVLATVEGTRPLLVEVQALVNKTSYGYPKRTASGIDLNRLNLLVAVLEKRTKLQLSEQDIYINIVGGMRINEPAADLAVCLAIGSAARGLQLTGNVVVFGEVGLSGEVRHVPLAEKRLVEAKKLGFDSAIGPRQRAGTPKAKGAATLHGVSDVRTALNTFLEKD
jgi:DNA repair protein RadA/Sms